MTLSPKSRFLASKELVLRHHDTVGSEAFQRACDATMLQFIANAPRVDDPIGAAANYHRLVGAQEFLKLLNSIGDFAEIAKTVETPRIVHKTESEQYARSPSNR